MGVIVRVGDIYGTKHLGIRKGYGTKCLEAYLILTSSTGFVLWIAGLDDCILKPPPTRSQRLHKLANTVARTIHRA